MEISFKLETPDGYLIHGTERYSGELPSRVVIFIHGLTGHSNELIHWLGAQHFSQSGYGAVRFELYGSQERARRLDNSTLTTHAQDVNHVVQHCRELGYEKIYLVGHSLGGPVVLMSNTAEITAIALWDPTYNTKLLVDESSYFDEVSKGRYIDWGIKMFWGTQMADELLALSDCKELVSKTHCPIKVITAEKKETDTNPEAYFEFANDPKAFAIIPGASHCFTEEHAPSMLLNETMEWFSQF
ncbi:MAG: alpha/beta fold hydrolase [Bdellovibrionales bacterium]|nr:alpha/beta fold hydrolase [Bdellovibrionales bacterium]